MSSVNTGFVVVNSRSVCPDYSVKSRREKKKRDLSGFITWTRPADLWEGSATVWIFHVCECIYWFFSSANKVWGCGAGCEAEALTRLQVFGPPGHQTVLQLSVLTGRTQRSTHKHHFSLSFTVFWIFCTISQDSVCTSSVQTVTSFIYVYMFLSVFLFV